MVPARKGRSGGYRLAAPAEEITAESAIRALDGPLAPIRCVSLNFYQRCEDCPDEAACVVRPTMLELRKAMLDVLSRISIARMRAMSEIPGEEEEKATPPARRPLRKPPPEA